MVHLFCTTVRAKSKRNKISTIREKKKLRKTVTSWKERPIRDRQAMFETQIRGFVQMLLGQFFCTYVVEWNMFKKICFLDFYIWKCTVILKLAKYGKCIKRKTHTKQLSSLVHITTSYPLELVCIDFLMIKLSTGGYYYIFVSTDHFTKFAISILTRN